MGAARKTLLRREMRDVRGEGGGWPPGWPEKMLQQSLQTTPRETRSSRTRLIPRLGLYESRTPTYTVKGKVTFEKWDPHSDLIH